MQVSIGLKIFGKSFITKGKFKINLNPHSNRKKLVVGRFLNKDICGLFIEKPKICIKLKLNIPPHRSRNFDVDAFKKIKTLK